MSRKESKMRVAVRVRPLNRRELETNQRTIIQVLDEKNILFDPEDDDDEFFYHGSKVNHRDVTKRVRKKLPMEYDHVFGDSSTNDDIYDSCMKPLITSLLEGYNCSVFVYGATGAGKTFTMLGNENIPGITFLTIEEMFRQMQEQSEVVKFDIGVSYLEVYNEQVMNLLTRVGPLKLREDSTGVVVSGLSLKPIYCVRELISLLTLGNKNRTQHPTDANAESSRSHAIFQVHIRMSDKKTGMKRTVKLSMIDLAGSERASSTKGIGVRFKEGASINKSLLALGNCINKLADGLEHIPYRDSNLTRILKDSLGGNCQTVMIANVSPSSLMYDDTYNTLKYASRAKKIKSTCRQNVIKTNLPVEFYAKKTAQHEEEIERLRKIIKQQEERIAELTAEKANNRAPQSMTHSLERPPVDRLNLTESYRKIDKIYDEIRSVLNTLIHINSKQNMLILRAKFKSNIEEQKKILYLDGSHTGSNISRFEASIDKYTRQLGDQDKLVDEWQEKYRSLLKELESLKEDVHHMEGRENLEIYMKYKDQEQTVYSQEQGHLHMNKIVTLVKTELENVRSAFLLACEIVQQTYQVMRTNNVTMDGLLKKKHQKLLKLIEGKVSIKFADEDENSFEALSKIRALDFIKEQTGGKRLLQVDRVINGITSKRRRLAVDEDMSLPPVPPFASTSSNSNHILSGIEPLSDNIGGDIPSSSTMNHTFKVLTDHKPNLPVPDVASKYPKEMKKKSSPKRIGKVTNENKKLSPYRLKRSPGHIKKPLPPGLSTMRNRMKVMEKKESSVTQKFWK